MKKYLISLLVVLVIIVLGAYISLFSKQSSYHKTIAASSSSVLILENFDFANIKIVTADTDEITLNLKGSEEDLAGIELSEDGIFARFGISAEFSSLSGTIVVPGGILIDVTLSQDRSIDIDGKQEVTSSDSFLIDTTTLNSFKLNSSGGVVLDSWGDLIVWDDETWDLLEDVGASGDGSVEGGEGSASDGLIYCGIGSQAIRNYCCVLENADTDTPDCSGLAYFVFDNSARDCAFKCELDDSQEEEDGQEVEQLDCGVGSQAVRNTCCADQHVGEYQGCLGSWYYNNAGSFCAFQCDVFDPVNDSESNPDGESVSFGDPVSDYCWTILDEEDRNLCCNDTLKNNLSSGPRPGFPDCIGKWYFDEELGCEFRCSDYVEMIQILNEIKQNVQLEQE